MNLIQRILLVLVSFVCFAGATAAQNGPNLTPNPYVYTVQADSTTGVTQFTLSKMNSSGNFVTLATTDACGVKGIALETQVGGTIDLAFGGLVYLKMDGASTIGDIIVPSSTTAGFGHDPGYSARTASGCTVGLVEQAISSSVAQVLLFQPEIEGLPPLVAPNDGSTGTTQNAVAKLNSSGNAINSTTSDTAIPTYPVVSPTSTSGNASIAYSGPAYCTMDSTIGSAATGDYVINSTTAAHECHAQSGAPSAGTWVIGYVVSTSTASGSVSLINVQGYLYQSGGGGGLPSAGINTVAVGPLDVPGGSSATMTAVLSPSPLYFIDPRAWVYQYDDFDQSPSAGQFGAMGWTSGGTGGTAAYVAAQTGTTAYGVVGCTAAATASDFCTLDSAATGSGGFWATYNNFASGNILFRIKLSQTTNTNVFFGFVDPNSSIHGEVSTSSFGFGYNVGKGDTTWMCVTNNSGTGTRTALTGTGSTPDTNWHTLRVRISAAGTINCSVDANTETTVSTHFPTSANMTPDMSIDNNATANAVVFQVDYFLQLLPMVR
jgi:hypothetical protein